MASYDRKLELDARVFTQCDKLLESALRGGKHLTRKEISAALERGGVNALGQRLAHILMHAELEALICSGSLNGKQFTYALFDERVPATRPLAREEALAKLALRYFQSHGPATVHDFSWWSGLRMGDSRDAVELVKRDLVQETIDGVAYWLIPSQGTVRARRPLIHLLPNYDEHVVAYRDHGPSFDPESLGGVRIRPEALMAYIVTRDGFVIGGWKRAILPGRIEITTDMLVKLTAAEAKALEKAAAAFGRFMGLPVVIRSRRADPKT
jgi:hypothetical protein